MSFQKFIVVGSVGQDAEIKYTPTNKKVITFSIATSRPIGNQKFETDWHNIVYWYNNNDHNFYDTISSGDLVLVSGRVTYKKWTTAENVKQIRTEIVASEIKILRKKTKN